MKLILISVILLSLNTSVVFAGYTVEIKNDSDIVVKSFSVTTAQVQHIQKYSVKIKSDALTQFKKAVLLLINRAEQSNLDQYFYENEEVLKDLAKD